MIHGVEKLKSKLIFVTAVALACSAAYAQTKVVVDPGKKYQLFEGWGTSLCWWAELAGGWDKANYTKLLGAVADPDTGLGYNIFRYNIGGGEPQFPDTSRPTKAITTGRQTRTSATLLLLLQKWRKIRFSKLFRIPHHGG